jgi:hypothetical protein
MAALAETLICLVTFGSSEYVVFSFIFQNYTFEPFTISDHVLIFYYLPIFVFKIFFNCAELCEQIRFDAYSQTKIV